MSPGPGGTEGAADPTTAMLGQGQRLGRDAVSLSDLASVGSAVSGFAILVSLIYLSVQIRQAQKNQRALMQQGRVARISSAAVAFSEPTVAEIIDLCWDGAIDISTIQLRQFSNVCRQLFISAEDSYLQYQDSFLSDAAYASLVASMRAYLTSPGIRAMWTLTRTWYEAGFAEFMERLMKEARAVPYADRLNRWREAVAREISDADTAERPGAA